MTRLSAAVKAEELTALRNARFEQPPDENALVGLAISGGGIRSATFGLGVLEALKEANLLGRIHYLSTVSGGGYIGAWFSANCRRARDGEGWVEEDWRAEHTAWDDSIAHLRRYSNYLSPDVGFFSADTWSMFTVWLRNTLLVQWTVIMAIACVLLVPRLLAVLFAKWYHFEGLRWSGVILFVLGVVGIAGNQQWVSRGKSSGLMRADRWPLGLGIAAACGVVGVLYTFAFDFAPFRHQAPGPLIGATVSPWGSLLVAALLVVGAYALLPLGVTVYGLFGKPEDRPEQVNYSQAQVQWLVVLPLLASGFCVGAVLWGEIGENAGPLANLHSYGAFFLEAWYYWPFPLAVVFCSLWLLSLCSVGRFRKARMPALGEPARRSSDTARRLTDTEIDWYRVLAAVVSPVACVVALHALLCAIMLLLQGWQPEKVARAFVIAPPLVLFAFSLTVVVLIGMMGRESTEGVREWWSRLGAWLLIYGAAWMLVAVIAVYAPGWVQAAFEAYPGMSWSSALGWIGTVAAGLFAGHSDQTGREAGTKRGNPILQIAASVAPFLFIAGLLIAVATALDHIIATNTGGRSWNHLWAPPFWPEFLAVSAAVLGVCLAILGLLGLRVDVNEFSLNAFYRSRLVRCFLGATRRPADRKPQAFTAFDDADDLPLADLGSEDKALAGPLHIINCALNLGGSGDLSLHTRHSASFTLTPFEIGTDYCHTGADGAPQYVGHTRTDLHGTAARPTTLGQAISVSGAAASPNMGYHTSPVVSFLLTVFNLRLGWWFPHPRIAEGQLAPHFSLRYMVMELFGSATYQSNFLMVSDGGHFENLGVYELLKRRCQVIIVSDAECDPHLTFEGLGTLIRMADVDLGAKIAIDVDALKRRDGGRWSEQRCAVGTIQYDDAKPNARSGILIYFKAAMTGHEPAAVLQYKASHPDFPHETTGDQFYAEDQFESYRRLGYEVANKSLESAIAACPAREMLALAATMRETNAPSLAATSKFTAHGQSLVDLWNRISEHKELEPLDSGLAIPGNPAKRLEVYTCLEMLQLMENVYLDLQLEETWEHADNHGWNALFQIWAASDAVQGAWVETGGLFGTRFQYFCQRNLKLPKPRPKPKP